MNGWQSFVHQFIIAIEPSSANSGQWRLIVALAIIVVGLFLLELLFQNARRRIQASLEKKGHDSAAWNISAVLPALRLAATAWLLQLAELVVVLAEQFTRILNAVQVLLLALAVISAIFWLISKLDYLRRALPGELQERFPEEALAKLNRLLRLTMLIAVAAVFLYSQKSLLPERMWQYSVWRYTAIVIVIVLVYLAIRQIGTFLTKMTIVLRDSKENVRLRLVLEAAIWPVRLLLFTVAICAAKEVLMFPPPADKSAVLMGLWKKSVFVPPG
ncbi:hypothetical protein JY97_14955 [Alkalispirochaeta odontotermitis]|nr:hypothetical protein JY97_14955 [Alkalispirochaeta odontotermitis]CAB1075977.1 hypothetical protein D1AOALGA4SA_3779 [Olavius algarvensis Delta 1 endosymbiont]